MNRLRYFLVVLIFLNVACQRPTSSVPNKFADSVFARISDFQDKRLSDSLSLFLKSTNDSYRRDAVLAFASLQDTSKVMALGELLRYDKNTNVRLAAAFALGQNPCLASEFLLAEALTTEKDNTVAAEILEAYGKICRSSPLELEFGGATPGGLAWSLYRAGLRKVDDSLMHLKAADLLAPTEEEATRLGSAHYFARGASGFAHVQQKIINSAKNDSSADVRMAATLALQKIPGALTLSATQSILQSDSDYRVRVSAVRVLQSLPFDDIKPLLYLALEDLNVNVGVAAAEAIKAIAPAAATGELSALARDSKNWRIQANLYEAALTSPNASVTLIQEVRDLYINSGNPYQKAGLLSALQHSVAAAAFIQEQFFNTDLPLIKLAAATSMVSLNYQKATDSFTKQDFSTFYINAMGDGDPAAIGIIASALTDPELGYKNIISDYSFLRTAADKMSLPKDYESLQPLHNAIAYFEGKEPTALLHNEYNHPIDWALVRQIPAKQQAIITTTKGQITMQLFVEEAPGSVGNFVALVRQQYFNGKYFHRVVPNFVVQTGCNRGDGWGSEDYSIRSEFSLRRYKTGSVGMASAGRDTEGTQWFITHSPTPHLDGRYSLFAEVTAGLDVLHQIEVGDKIINIDLK